MSERSASAAARKGAGALAAGLQVGWIVGIWDGVAIVAANPQSFPDAGRVGGFLAASLTLGLLAGAAGGAVAAALRRGPGVTFGAGLALWIFFWAGVRVHVRYFFGDPLASWPGSGAYAAVALGAALLAVGAVRATAAVRGRLAGRAFAGATAAVTVLAAAAALVLAPRPGAAPAAVAPPAGARDVLLLTLDTTRADHLSVYGYPRGTTPALDRLARRGTVYPAVYAPIPLTNPSHASLMTGRLPREHGVRNNGTALAAGIPTLAQELAAAGWECAAFVSGIPLKAGLSGLSPGFSRYDDAFSPLERIHPMLTTLAVVRVANRVLPVDFIERRAARTCAAAAAWLAGTDGARPRFLWVHLFDPHSPYDAPGVLRARFAAESPEGTANGRAMTDWPVADYDAEIRETDRHAEDLLRAFRLRCPDGVVVVTADHGEGLEQHGELTHGTQLYQEDLHVPCLIAGDGRAAGQVDASGERSFAWLHERLRRAVRGTPTAPHDPEGRGDPVAPDAPGGLLAETFAPEGRQDQSAVLARLGGGLRKLWINWETGEERAFDLEQDPGERNADAALAERDALRDRMPARPESGDADLDPETVRRLRALGYLH